MPINQKIISTIFFNIICKMGWTKHKFKNVTIFLCQKTKREMKTTKFTFLRGRETFDIMSSSIEESKREQYDCLTATRWWGDEAQAISTITCNSLTPFRLDFRASFANLASLSGGSYVHKLTAFCYLNQTLEYNTLINILRDHVLNISGVHNTKHITENCTMPTFLCR